MLLDLVVVLVLLCLSCVSASSSSISNKNGSNEIIRCMDKERRALLAFRDGLTVTSDDSSLLSWITKDCCEWIGVECDNQTGHVTKLALPLGLAGKISPSLLELPELAYLDLSSIDFENRPIPMFLGSFTKLKRLDLSNCNFSGIIPSQLGNLSNLNYLALSSDPSLNLSVENIDWLSRLSSLETLYMDGVDLSRATHWIDIIRSLPFLSTLDFSHCQLSNVMFPSSSSSWMNSSSSTSIKELHLSYNGLTSSSVLFNLSSLMHLDISYNMLNRPDLDVFGDYLHSLQFLDLSSNLFEGMIPNSFGNLCNLKVLYMKNSSLSGNLTDFLDILSGSRCTTTPALELLSVDDNKLFGPLPDGIIKFSSIIQLSLSVNQLNGTITKNMGKLSQLEWLDLSSNSLTGIVSEAHFSNLSRLTLLHLSGNDLHIKVSPQWSPPFQLTEIRLMSCNLGPLFPNWIRTQKNFVLLDISKNGISNSIPPWLWDLSTQSSYLNLSSNNFRGTLPDMSSKKFQRYSGFDLSSNNFEGPIPLLPSTLEWINLSRNKFSGNLDFLCQLNHMAFAFLDISQNLLTGGLPDCLGKLEQLKVVNVAHNRLSGEIPFSIGSLFRLESLYLFNNSFAGVLPLSLSNCVQLSFLDIGVNKLTGNVPSWIGGNVSQLHVLGLRSNKFNGTIPLNLCHLNNLQVLDLSQNNLHGTIPPCLNNLTAMVHKGIELNNHQYLSTVYPTEGFYIDYSVIGWQGRDLEFGNNLARLKLIDLSSNNLIGEIPDEITNLFELVALNLSRNALLGKVPQEIGQLKSIISLDLSRNKFSGKLPDSLSQLSFLSHLDLSYKFSGKVPSGTQLQSQDASKFIGNVGLCGPPLISECLGVESPPTVFSGEDNRGENDDEFMKWLYIGMASGFVTGFWGICGAVLLNRRGRHAFFRITNDFIDWVYVKIAACKF